MNTNNFADLAAYALTTVDGIGLALAIGFFIYVRIKKPTQKKVF